MPLTDAEIRTRSLLHLRSNLEGLRNAIRNEAPLTLSLPLGRALDNIFDAASEAVILLGVELGEADAPVDDPEPLLAYRQAEDLDLDLETVAHIGAVS